jgi:hypothetical protein
VRSWECLLWASEATVWGHPPSPSWGSAPALLSSTGQPGPPLPTSNIPYPSVLIRDRQKSLFIGRSGALTCMEGDWESRPLVSFQLVSAFCPGAWPGCWDHRPWMHCYCHPEAWAGPDLPLIPRPPTLSSSQASPLLPCFLLDQLSFLNLKLCTLYLIFAHTYLHLAATAPHEATSEQQSLTYCLLCY